ncbi:MAG: hypothetical protein J5I50_05195 [Chitinophagaceae bacterium]|nr:hypothetical protein [Chitinophagaceae bacterium]
MAGNPNFYKGMQALPGAGRPKVSVRTPKGMLERFLMKALKPSELKNLYERLPDKEKASFIVQTLPYIMPRQSSVDGMSAQDVDKIYSEIMATLNNHGNAKTG